MQMRNVASLLFVPQCVCVCVAVVVVDFIWGLLLLLLLLPRAPMLAAFPVRVINALNSLPHLANFEVATWPQMPQ